jgi:hypothetical protein
MGEAEEELLRGISITSQHTTHRQNVITASPVTAEVEAVVQAGEEEEEEDTLRIAVNKCRPGRH